MREVGEEEVMMGSLLGLVYIHESQAGESTEYVRCTYDIVAWLGNTERESTTRGNYFTGDTGRKRAWLKGLLRIVQTSAVLV